MATFLFGHGNYQVFLVPKWIQKIEKFLLERWRDTQSQKRKQRTNSLGELTHSRLRLELCFHWSYASK